MSILIKDMEMPKDCKYCKFRKTELQEDPDWCLISGESLFYLAENDCPLIEVSEDVQPVVRCKDCKHFHLDYFGEVNGVNIIVAHEVCDLWAGGCRTMQDAFCSNGVRRDGNNNG